MRRRRRSRLKMARVLVTRPAADCARTGETLRALGHEAVLSPVLDVRTLPVELPSRNWQAALFTSRNAAIRASSDAIGCDTTCLAVGAATAEAVRARGFATVHEAGGDATSLFDLALARLRPDDGPLVHPCGVHRSGRLPESLQAHGFEVVTAPCYETVFLPLADHARAMLVTGEIDVVLLYSARSARAFAAAVEGIELSAVALLAMSESVADALPQTWRKWTHWPARPSETGLLASLDELGDKV